MSNGLDRTSRTQLLAKTDLTPISRSAYAHASSTGQFFNAGRNGPVASSFERTAAVLRNGVSPIERTGMVSLPCTKVPTTNQPSRKVVERQVIGASSFERVEWLKNVISRWDIDKLIYEFAGPNKANWEILITDGLSINEVIELISRQELLERPAAMPLYLTLQTPSPRIGVVRSLGRRCGRRCFRTERRLALDTVYKFCSEISRCVVACT